MIRVMNRLYLLHGARRHHDAARATLEARDDALGQLARYWFEVVRGCGEDVTEVLHHGQITACVDSAAFAYVHAFTGHVNLGFFRGNALPDPAGLLQGTGKWMRHVKLRSESPIDEAAVRALIEAAYRDIRERLAQKSPIQLNATSGVRSST